MSREGSNPRSVDHMAAERVAEYILEQIPGFSLNESGIARIQRWLVRYGLDEITSAVDISFRQYLEPGENGRFTEESVHKSFEYIERIANIRRREQNEPELRDLLYVRGIARRRCGYFKENEALEMLRRAHALGADVEELKELARSCRNWTEWRHDMESLLLDLVHRKAAP